MREGLTAFDQLFGEPVEGNKGIELTPPEDLQAILKEQVDTVLAGLTPRQRFVIERRFGLAPDAQEGLTYVETGIALSESVGRRRPYSERYIRQIEAKALYVLRRHPARRLQDYLVE